MIRRDFFKTPFAVTGLALGGTTAAGTPAAAAELAQAPGLTRYVAEFIVNTKYDDIPEDVIALGKKTILDGFGLALAGSVSTLGPPLRRYISSLGFAGGKASIIGTTMKVRHGLRRWPTAPPSTPTTTTTPVRRSTWRGRRCRRRSRSARRDGAAARI